MKSNSSSGTSHSRSDWRQSQDFLEMLQRLTQPEDWSVGLNWFALLLRRVAHGRKVTTSNCMINYFYFLCMFVQCWPNLTTIYTKAQNNLCYPTGL